MKIHLHTENHGGPSAGIIDFVLLIRLLTEAAGHEWVEGDCAGGLHVWLECNIDCRNLDAARASGGRVVILATERLTGSTFNNFGGGGSHYGNHGMWQNRYCSFVEAAKHADVIWTASDSLAQAAAYKELTGLPVCQLPYPHCDRLPQIAPRPKDLDVFFSGSMTPWRSEMQGRLKAVCDAVAFCGMIGEGARMDHIARAKVCVCVLQTATWPYASETRRWRFMNHGACVVVEQCSAEDGKFGPYVLNVPGEELPARCAELVASGDWQRVARECYERFADEQPAGPAARALIEQSMAAG